MITEKDFERYLELNKIVEQKIEQILDLKANIETEKTYRGDIENFRKFVFLLPQ